MPALTSPYPTLELVCDGLARVASYRTPRRAAPDAVVWLHGGNEWATQFLDGIRARPGIVDVAPQGLINGDNPGWVNPWESSLPRQASDSLVDVRFIVALEDRVRRAFPSVRRVWLCGFSAGGSLVWTLWALRARFPHGFSGLGVAGKKLRRDLGPASPWAAQRPAPIPFVMVHGAADDIDDPSAAHFSWEESYAEARRVNGNAPNAIEVARPRHSSCCGAGNLVHRKVASGGGAPSARYVVDRVGHTWQSCTDCHTDDFVIEQFSDYGLGG